MTLAEVMFSIAESNPNCKKFRFVTRTIPHLNKKSRSTGKPTDFSVEKRSEFIASLGVNYENEVNDILESQGKKRNFEAQKAPGKHYVNGTNWLMESDKTPGVFYIALSHFEDRKSKYYINGVEVTPEQLDDLRENYLPKYKVNNNPDKPFVEWQTYLIENIISIEAI